MTLLECYESASGQVINRQKTSIFFSKNTRAEVKHDIQSMLGARIMEGCKRYLGLPMAGGKSKVKTFKDLREKITNRFLGWKEKYVSKVGREVLIKTVAQAIPTYSISINSAKYWWG